MSSEMNWALDFCLYCDKQTHTDEPYCSQACRLADLEKPGFSSTYNVQSSSHSHTHSSSSSTRYTSSWSSTAASRPSRFHLAAPINFDSYRHRSSSSKVESPPQSPRSKTSSSSKTQRSLASARPTTHSRSTDYQLQPRGLNNSSSRSSLSSVSSANSIQGLSEQALTQLQDYANAFDHVRDSRRRVTLG